MSENFTQANLKNFQTQNFIFKYIKINNLKKQSAHGTPIAYKKT